MTLVGPGKVVACTTILFLIIQVSRVQAASISAVNVHALSSRNASTGHVRPSGSLAMAATPRQSGDQTAEPSASVAVGELRLLALPVGQGDSTVIVCPEYDGNIVIYDMGSTQQAWSADRVRSYLEESTINGERSLMDRLTTIIISHAHTDHYNYIPQVFPHFLERHRKRLNSTQARRRNSTRSGNDREQDTHKHPSEALSSHQLDKLNVFVSGKLEDYIYYDMEEWLTAAGAQTFNAGEECFMSECSRGNSWTESICGAASDARFRVISANMGLDGGNKNEQSVVLRVDIGSHNALLVGDFEGEAQVELIDKVDTTEPGLLISDVYKISHHGASRLSNWLAWILAVQARQAFVSSMFAGQSQYGHPKCETFYRLLSAGTLDAAPAHTVGCTDESSELVRMELEHSIFSTMPKSADEACIIQVTLSHNGAIQQPALTCSALERERLD